MFVVEPGEELEDGHGKLVLKRLKQMRGTKRSESDCSDSRVPECINLQGGQKLLSPFLV